MKFNLHGINYVSIEKDYDSNNGSICSGCAFEYDQSFCMTAPVCSTEFSLHDNKLIIFIKEDNEIEEKLANLCHEQWTGWMNYLFNKCKRNKYGQFVIPNWAAKRWLRQMNTDYADLSEKEKESDRIEARKFIEVINENNL